MPQVNLWPIAFRLQVLRTGIKRLLVPLVLAALALCVWMMVHALSGMSMPGCGTGSGCDSVMSGRWAYIAGLVPVSALAVGAYLALLLCLFSFKSDARTASRIMLVLGGAIIGMALWFTAIQAFVLHTFCKYCMAAHVLGTVIAVLIICSCTGHRWQWLAAGIGLAALTAAVQYDTLPDAAYAEGAAQEPLPLFSADQVPTVGPKDAPVQVELMFDYRCSHCRSLHAMLPQLVDMFQGRVAFLLLPTPLSNACNYYIPQGPDPFEGSCTLTRLALAVWQAAPDRFPEYDGWLFLEGPDGWYPRTESDAVIMAQQIVADNDAFESAYSNMWTMDYLTKVFELFGRTTNGRSGGIPRFVYGQKWLVPDADTPEAVYELLEKLINRNDEE